MGVSSPNTYFPHTISDSQQRMVHSKTDDFLLHAGKSSFAWFQGEVVKQCHYLTKLREVKVRGNVEEHSYYMTEY